MFSPSFTGTTIILLLLICYWLKNSAVKLRRKMHDFRCSDIMLIKSFLDYLRYERNYSEKTVLAYSEDIKQLQEFAQEEYGRFNPLEVEAELIREWIVSLMDRGYTSTSVNRKLSSLRSFSRLLSKEKQKNPHPCHPILSIPKALCP